MKIAFHIHNINIRGTSVSLYDYANYNEILLHGKSIVITCKTEKHDPIALYKFQKRFEMRYYDSFESDIDSLVSDCDIFYTLKYGLRDYLPKNIKTCVHCVFDMTEPHGDVYAGVSETLAQKFNREIYVPHMISIIPSTTNDNLRKSLGINTDSIVFGRHGGKDTFDLEIVINAIIKVLINFSHIHFIFVNTPKFVKHPNVHYIEKIVDLDEKNRFIMSCDAMIHAQSLGETFGLAIGEFSVNNKPIIAYNGPVWNDHYKKILGNNALWYNTEEECYKILSEFDKNLYLNKDLNFYKEYIPEKVMKKFKEVFIDDVSLSKN